MKTRRTAEQSGFSLIEVTIASVLVLALAYMVVTLSIGGMDAQKFAERMARVTEITQDLVDEMRRGLASSVRILTDEPTALAYRDMLDLDDMSAPLASSRLPALDADGRLEADTATSQKTGNTLFFARYAWTDQYETAFGNQYRIDVYRMEYFYLTAAGGGPAPGSPIGLNLARFVSEPLADGSQIDAIEDPTERAEVLKHLLSQSPDVDGNTHDKCEVVWLVGEDPADPTTLRQIDSTGALSESTVAPREATWRILPQPELSDAGLVHFRHHSVASIHARDSLGVGRFGFVDDSGDGFPHGFETQVIGPSSARQVLLHLTLVSTNNRGHRAHHDMQVVVDVRDL